VWISHSYFVYKRGEQLFKCGKSTLNFSLHL